MKLRIAVLFALLAAGASAQVRESVTVNLVEVPVTVIDSNGNPVRGLTAANFEIYDQGKKQQVTSFDTIDFAVRESVNALSPLNPAARRSFLLLFDLGYSTPNSMVRAQEAARRFVTDSVQPRDLVGVGTIDVDRGFHLLTAFTTDRQLVASAIGDPAHFRSTDPLQIANQRSTFDFDDMPNTQYQKTEILDRSAGGGSERTAAFGPAGVREAVNREMALAHEVEVSAAMKRGGTGMARKRIEKQVDALGDLAKLLATVPGRKQVILLSEGFDPTFLQGRNARAEAAESHVEHRQEKNENDRAMAGELWAVDSDLRYGNNSSLSLLDRMAGYFRTSDVVLHAIDIKGVRVQNDVSEGAKINANDGLFTLALPTGGVVFQNSNDLKDDFARLLHGQEVVYVLGFQSSSTKPGAFHPLKVKVVGASAANVSYRAGYLESGAESAPAEHSLTDAEIIMNDVPQRDIRIDALTAALPGDAAHGEVPLVLEINGEDLLRTAPADGNALAEVYVYAFDRDGVVRDRLYEKMRMDMAKAGERLRATGAKWIGMLNLPPGQYAVKALVRVPGTERRGFARVDLRVPGAGEMAASPFFIDQQPRQWVVVRGTTLDPARFPFAMGSEALMPSAAARLRKGESRRFALFVSGVSVDQLKVDAALLRANGAATSAAPRMIAQAESPGVTKLVFDCDSAGLDPGPAALRIVVHRNGMNDLKATLPLVVSQ